MKSCCAHNCTNRFVPKRANTSENDPGSSSGSNIITSQTNTPGRSFHRFPKDEEMRRLWIAAINRADFKPNNNTYICSDHFLSTNYKKGKQRTFLKQSAVPFGKSLTERRKIKKTTLKKVITKKGKTIPKVDQQKKPITPTEFKLQKKIKVLQQNIRRKSKKLKNLKGVIDQMKKDKLISKSHACY